MARQYSLRDFLRRAPNPLLARYFDARRLLGDVDIASLEERDIDRIFDAWEELSLEDRDRVDADFALVDRVAEAKGIEALIEEGPYHKADLAPVFEDMRSFHEKTLWTFLEYPVCVEIAARFIEADHLPGYHWMRRWDDVPNVEPRDDGDACGDLAAALVSYFRLKEGRGQHCVVDVYKRGSRYYYFAFPEDHGRAEPEFTEAGTLEPRPRRPAFQVVFAYDPDAPAMETYYEGGKSKRQELEQIFGRVILRDDLQFGYDDRAYDLNRFKRRGVQFVRDPSWGIEDVRVKLLRMALIGGGQRRVTVEADPSEERNAIYDLVSATFDRDDGRNSGLSLALANVTRVGIEVRYVRTGHRGMRKKTFYLTHPNGCDLKHDGRDLILREMLVRSGIEPGKAKTTVDAT